MDKSTLMFHNSLFSKLYILLMRPLLPLEHQNVKYDMSRIVTSVSILRSLKEEAVDAAKKGQFPGVSDFSSMVELALDHLLHQGNSPERVASVEVEQD